MIFCTVKNTDAPLSLKKTDGDTAFEWMHSTKQTTVSEVSEVFFGDCLALPI